MAIRLVSNESSEDEKGNVFWSTDVDNYPPDLVEKIINYVSKKGHQTDNKNIAVGFLKNCRKGVSICPVAVRFINGTQGTQYIVFEKNGISDWRVIQESEVMIGKTKSTGDKTLQWFYLEE